MLCVAILGSDVGQNRSENVGDHKLVSDLAKNRSENSPTRPKTGRRFSVSDLSRTVKAQSACGADQKSYGRKFERRGDSFKEWESGERGFRFGG